MVDKELRTVSELIVGLLNAIDPEDRAIVYVDDYVGAKNEDSFLVIDAPVQNVIDAIAAFENGGDQYVELGGMDFDFAHIETITYGGKTLYARG